MEKQFAESDVILAILEVLLDEKTLISIAPGSILIDFMETEGDPSSATASL